MTSEEFEKIYQIYFKDVYFYILTLSRDKHIAEDITSLRKNKKIDFKEDLKNLIGRENTDTLEKHIISKDQLMQIDNIIHSSLEEPYGEIFRLRVYSELSFKEIGSLFGKTDNWACVTYHRARKKLQKELEGKL